jgi:two-component system CheB/CheR fusion protein
MTFFNVDKIKQADKFKRLATVLSDSNDAITVQDLEGNILAWNKGATQLYGWTESQALKMNIREILPKDNIQDIYFIVEKLLKGDSIPSFKTKRKTKDGTIFDVWMTITALSDKKGQLIEFATTERDLAWLSIEEVGNHEKS